MRPFLLSAAALAHLVADNVDFGLAANILIGSIPGVIIGSALSGKAPQGFIRLALGIVLMASGVVTIQKGDATVWPIAAGVAAVLLGAVLYAPHYMNRRYRREKERAAARPRPPSRSPDRGGGSGPGLPALGPGPPDAGPVVLIRHMRVSAKADYAVRAAVELAAAGEGEPVKGERLATSQDIPLQFLEHILLELKHQGLVRARRGAKGGYWLARPADEVTVADVVRAVEGPIANVQSMPPETIEYAGNAETLRDVWIAVRANIRSVLERVTLADLVAGELPAAVAALAAEPDSWAAR